MKPENKRALLSLVLFLLCFALTVPFVTGALNFSSLFDSPAPSETENPDVTTEDPYDPSHLWDSTQEPVDTSSPQPATAPETGTASPESTVSPENTTIPGSTASSENTTSPKESATAPVTAAPVTTPETKPQSGDTFAWKTVDADYFSDALFIGDSRTARLMISAYTQGMLGNAMFFCGESWSCSYAMKTKASDFTQRQLSTQKESDYLHKFPVTYYALGANEKANREVGRMSLEDLLKTYNFGKIYIMFGINEIGGTVNGIYQNIARMVTMCRTLRPDAKIFLEGNLLMTKTYSDNNKYGKNDKLLDINAKIATLADWSHIFYIDINDLMGDGKGNASTDFVTGAHQNLDRCDDWVRWLYTKGV